MHWDIRHSYKMLVKKAGRKVRNGLENLNVDGRKYQDGWINVMYQLNALTLNENIDQKLA